mmetsp:Transcript_2235/g.5639  ORF Transcript_2235/g.5639 Transcript_2235/m.5639 type:complete len:430 (-) Transcript_2235:162-1451(-)
MSSLVLFDAEDLVEGLLDLIPRVDGLERVLPEPVPEAEHADAPDVLLSDLRPALEGRDGLGRAVGHDVASQPIHVQHRAHLGNLHPDLPVHRHVLQHLPRLLEPVLDRRLRSHVLGTEGRWLFVEPGPLLDDLHSELGVLDGPDLRVHAEPIQELRPQLALLRVARADQDEAGRVGDGDALTLDRVPAGSGRVQHHVDEVVVEEVDLVDVQEAPVGLGQEARLEGLDAASQRALNVDGAAHPVLSGAQGQVDHGHAHVRGLLRLAAVELLRRLGAHQLAVVRRRVEGVVRHDFDLRQDVHERPHGGALPGAAVPHNHHAADLWVDDVEAERELHLLLAHDGGQRVHGPRLLLLRLGGLRLGLGHGLRHQPSALVGLLGLHQRLPRATRAPDARRAPRPRAPRERRRLDATLQHHLCRHAFRSASFSGSG